ncbi:C1 family peptidase [Nicoliella spurrieriana]|uniref:Aminopeptidase n=1 Tax=Nicoliella spurrieriana TaxID=2925830 RepID=A0A976RSS4_9LACO|nr:C1 family peptidase [Nicoliella spurrieriana]UQS87230.1 C1 family peptidase [Nicoliella spurrieriana]
MTESKNALTANDIADLEADYQKQPQADVIARAIQQNGVNNTARDPKAVVRTNHVFSVEVKTGGVTNQRQSGRCWLFSLTNNLRHQFAAKYGVKEFELSQSYLFFWDKIERANIFYDRMISTANRPTTDRTVAFYLSGPGNDGGQWAMSAALVQKYGVMPQADFPETNVTKNTRDLNSVLNLKLRRDGMQLRNLVNDGVSDEELTQVRQKMLSEVYRMVGYSVGVPPAKFDFEYRDDKDNYHLDQGLTPKQFFDKYFDDDLDDYVVLANSPDKPYNQLYSLPSQNNVVGGKQIQFVNLPMEVLKTAAIKQLQAGKTVWFGNDVVEQSQRKDGILDANLYHRAELYNIDLSMSKAERLQYHQAEVSHAMVLTGVDLVDDQPTRWKVENSWGADNGKKGYFAMDDSWMDEFVYEVVVNKKYLTADQQAVLEQAPVELAPWDSLS